jgi:glycosyltransferase involved in cell wall biosynthesis
MISIITATYNAERDLPQLISSLRSQTNPNFQWIVADGGSTDETLRIIEKNRDLVSKFIPGPDFGIYDALNKAVVEVETKYYLTLGADDSLYPDAVENYTKAADSSDADFISALVRTTEGTTLLPKRGNRFRFGHLAYVSQHAVGTLIKTSLHNTVGPYSRRFPIAADRYFILKTIERYGGSVQAEAFEAGIYSCAGTSGVHYYEALLDIFKVDYVTSRRPLLSAITSLIRYGINLRKM